MNKDVFNMPKAVTIAGRKSSLTNSFYNGIVPVIKPSEEEIKNALKILKQDENDVRCVYCGDKKTEWDHLHPLIIDKHHTGYITEIANLVPACTKCNSSKGNKNWKEWMLSDAKKSPKTRKIPDLEKRIKLIEKYDKHFKKTIINLKDTIDPILWTKYNNSYNILMENLRNTQFLMDQIKDKWNKEHKNYIKNQNDNNDIVEQYLSIIGKSIFIKYFCLFIDYDTNQNMIRTVMENLGDYSKNIRMKISTGKRIINEGYAKEALKSISSSDKESDEDRKKAKEYLSEYFGEVIKPINRHASFTN